MPADTLVILATYNEIENLPALVDEIFRHAPAVDILVVDDNSPDGTGRWCDEWAANDTRVRCLHREGKLGLGSAVIAGMKEGLAQGYRYVVNMDADFSHPPRYLPALLGAMEPTGGIPLDVAIGSRYVAGGGVEGWPLSRRWMSRAMNFYARRALSLPVRDCSGSFRCYRASRLAELDFSEVRSRGYSFFEEILWRLARRGCRLGETPITFVDRTKGKSKINAREACSALGTIAALGWQNLRGK